MLLRLLFIVSVWALHLQRSFGQVHHLSLTWIDSLATSAKIPGLIWIQVDGLYHTKTSLWGQNRLNNGIPIDTKHAFRLGSASKTLTALLIAEAVLKGKMHWEDRFLETCPEFKPNCKPGYADLRLIDLLNMQTALPSWTYTWEKPDTLSGSAEEQREKFIRWCLRQTPVPHHGSFRFTNPAYVLAARMLEKASGKRFRELAAEWAKENHLELGFGAPNQSDSSQTWGHWEDGREEAPAENPRLEWLEPAGNLSMNAASMAQYLRVWLRILQDGHAGQDGKKWQQWLRQQPTFSMGWFSETLENQNVRFWHLGNPGSFMCRIELEPELGKATAVLVNRQSKEAEAFMLYLCRSF